MNKPKSDFDKWFKAQFGGLPDFEKLASLKIKAEELNRRLWETRNKIFHLEALETKYNTSVYARNATIEKFKIK